MSRYVDPVLLAVSDCVVMTALERAGSRALPRSQRAPLAQRDRHLAYLRFPIPESRIDHALAGAWETCGVLAWRHDVGLRVPTERWAALLDQYARALLLTCEPHELPRLAQHLAPLSVGDPATRAFVAVG